MDENDIKIPLYDGKYAYGKVWGGFEDQVVIFVHGLTGNIDELLTRNAAKFFSENGLSFLAFNLYDYHDDARSINETTIKTHADDIGSLIEYCKSKDVKSIHIIGHSLAVYSIFMLRSELIKSVALWDPSYLVSSSLSPEKLQKVEEIDSYILSWGVDYVLSAKYIEAVVNLDLPKTIQSYSLPTLILNAGEGVLLDGGKYYESKLKDHVRVERYIIEGADHNFLNDSSRKDLFKKTLIWLKNFL